MTGLAIAIGVALGATGLAAIPGGWVGAAAALRWWGRRDEPGGGWDAIVVPGARVRPDGTASGALDRRTRAAVALWERGVAERIVLSGGPCHHERSEAEVGAAIARDLGVPDDAVLLEAEATSTAENASRSAALLGPARIVVVTDDFHAARCRRLFGAHFEEVAIVGAPTPWRSGMRMALREVPVVLFLSITR